MIPMAPSDTPTPMPAFAPVERPVLADPVDVGVLVLGNADVLDGPEDNEVEVALEDEEVVVVAPAKL